MSASIDDDLLPSWGTLLADYIEPGMPGFIVVRGSPRVAIFVDSGGLRFGAQVELTSEGGLPSSPLAEIAVVLVLHEGVRHLEISTFSRPLYRDFYLLVGELVRAVVTEGASPTAALVAALYRWQTLVSLTKVLTEERQIGLFGELWLFERLLPTLGSDTLDAWVGPTAQAHDFRLAEAEFEVKSTSASRRVHIINGLGQLSPSPGCRLFLLSLQITAAGAGGRTLPEFVAALKAQVSALRDGVSMLTALLAAASYRDADAEHYPKRRRIGGPARLVPVEPGCPRLDREAVSLLPPGFAPERILDADYKIDVEGLGYADGDPAFLAVLP